MFLISEVHPFDDGNGRLARLAMNAELSNAGQHRILVPIISRNDYLNGLRRLSRDQDPNLLCRVLATLWRWSSQVDHSDLALARVDMDRTNALVDPSDAERMPVSMALRADVLQARGRPFDPARPPHIASELRFLLLGRRKLTSCG
jgi:hypothetical protein